MDKELFINSILNSTNSITKVLPDESLFNRIESRISKNSMSKNTLWLVAASIVMLISINIILLLEKSNTIHSELTSLEHSINKSNQLYK